MTAEHTPELATSLSVYALGALDGEDLRALEEHLAAGCGDCRTALAAGEGSLELLATSVAPVAPSPQARARVLAALGGTDPIGIRAVTSAPIPIGAPVAIGARRASRRGWGWLAAAAALVLLVWSGYGQWVSKGEIARLAADRDRLERQVSGLGSQLAAARALSASPMPSSWWGRRASCSASGTWTTQPRRS